MWPNFRNLKHYKNIFRSCSPDLIDWNIVENNIVRHSISSVIDLRTTKEQGENTVRLKEKVKYYNFPLISDDTSISKILHPQPSDYTEYYIGLLHDNREKIVEILETVADSAAHGSVLIFCHAGKDRTGVVSWLLQELIMATDIEIGDDYEKTAELLLEHTDIFKPKWESKGLSKQQYIPRLLVTAKMILDVKTATFSNGMNMDQFFHYNFNNLRIVLTKHMEHQ